MWPRYHQLDVVRQALADVRAHGAGKRYLIQHSAGSGKSNSIAWLAHQLIGVKRTARKSSTRSSWSPTGASSTTRSRRPSSSSCRWARRWVTPSVPATCASSSNKGKKIIVSTVQKFPFILDEIATEGGKNFAIIIDEAHSSQGGKTSAAMSQALGDAAEDEERGPTRRHGERGARKTHGGAQDADQRQLLRLHRHAEEQNAGDVRRALPPDAEGKVKHRPFHGYTMKQAIEEGFILDVLKTYTPVDSYYKLVKKTEDDPEFDTKKAQKKLRRYVESHDHAIRLKAEIMVDHFHEQVMAAGKIGGQARAMVVTSGIERAIQYFHAFKTYLVERKSPYQAIVAFSGEHEYGGAKVSEASLNGFPSSDIADKIQTDPYRFLICADKFQTGYDEPLLHTMYVDKPLAGIKAVQTLSRLNRAHPQKHDCFVLDFQNNSEAITFAFQDYYRTTLLAEETDPNKLHDLKAALDGAQVYSPEQVQQVVELFLGGADRDKLDPILDACVAVYVDTLDEDGQVDFKGKAKVFSRTYDFLSSVMPYSNAGMGEALDLAESADAEAAGTEGGGPRQGHPRSHRHGQLPRREEGGAEDRAGRRGRGDRARANRRRRTQARAGDWTASATSSRLSTSSSARCSPTPTASRSESATTSRRRSPPTRPTRMPRRTRRTPRAWPTTRRWAR